MHILAEWRIFYYKYMYPEKWLTWYILIRCYLLEKLQSHQHRILEEERHQLTQYHAAVLKRYQDILTELTKSTILYFLHQSIFSSYKPCPVCDTSSAAPPRGLVKTPRIPLPMPRTIPEAGEFLASRSLLFSDWIKFCMGWSARPATAPV